MITGSGRRVTGSGSSVVERHAVMGGSAAREAGSADASTVVSDAPAASGGGAASPRLAVVSAAGTVAATAGDAAAADDPAAATPGTTRTGAVAASVPFSPDQIESALAMNKAAPPSRAAASLGRRVLVRPKLGRAKAATPSRTADGS